MFLSQANRFCFGLKILGQSKAIWFGLEIVLGKIEHFYIIQKLIDRNEPFWFGPHIIGTKAKCFNLFQNYLKWNKNETELISYIFCKLLPWPIFCQIGPLKAVAKLFKDRKISAKLIFFLSNIDSPYQRYAESTTPRITDVSVTQGVDGAAYIRGFFQKLYHPPPPPSLTHPTIPFICLLICYVVYSLNICTSDTFLGLCMNQFLMLLLHCNKKWAKRSFPLENNPSEEGKFPCGCWNIYPATHTVFIHYSVREKCSRMWTGTFYQSKKVKFLELSLTQIFSGNFPHSVFLKDIFRKIPAFPREECSPWLILEKLTLET